MKTAKKSKENFFAEKNPPEFSPGKGGARQGSTTCFDLLDVLNMVGSFGESNIIIDSVKKQH